MKSISLMVVLPLCILFGSMHSLDAQSSGSGCYTCSGQCYDYGMNPPVVFADCCECNWLGSIDYLYWKPYEDCIEWTCVKKIDFTQNISKHESSAEHKMINYDWDSGFRVGLGYAFPCDKWALNIEWTHYRTDAKKKINMANPSSAKTGNSTQTIISFCLPFTVLNDSKVSLSPEGCHLFSGLWRLQFNDVALSLSRMYYAGPCLMLRPHIGLSFLEIKQNMTTCLEYPISFIADIRDANANGKFKCEFKGVGIEAGLDSNFEIGCGLGIYGKWNTAIHYGTFDTTYDTLIIFSLDNSSVVTKGSLNPTYQALRCSTDLALGVSWSARFNCDRNLFIFKAGWEHHCYFNQNMFNEVFFKEDTDIGNVIDTVNPLKGDLYLYGFVFSGSIAF